MVTACVQIVQPYDHIVLPSACVVTTTKLIFHFLNPFFCCVCALLLYVTPFVWCTLLVFERTTEGASRRSQRCIVRVGAPLGHRSQQGRRDAVPAHHDSHAVTRCAAHSEAVVVHQRLHCSRQCRHSREIQPVASGRLVHMYIANVQCHLVHMRPSVQRAAARNAAAV